MICLSPYTFRSFAKRAGFKLHASTADHRALMAVIDLCQSDALPGSTSTACCRGLRQRQSFFSSAQNAPDDYQQGDREDRSRTSGAFRWACSVSLYHAGVASPPDVAGKAAAPIESKNHIICLVTGSLWGRPTQNRRFQTRLTSMLVLLLLYLGVACWPGRRARCSAAAILSLVGAVNLIIKFSVDW